MQKAVAAAPHALPTAAPPGAAIAAGPIAASTAGSMAASAAGPNAAATAMPVLLALSLCHGLNDLMQSMIPALYPILKTELGLDYTQIGLITLAFQLTASLLQPTVGTITDRHPQPYSLSIGMGSTLVGLVLLAFAHSYGMVLFSAALVGIGSAVFHPEASRVARLASGGRYGFAQSLFQVGGNAGSAIGPLLAALVVLPRGQGAIAWFSLMALAAMLILTRVGMWYAARPRPSRAAARAAAGTRRFRQGRVVFLIAVLMVLMFSKNVYTASLGSYFTFYLIERHHLPVFDAQVMLFIYMAAVALGTLIGGQMTDRIGRLPMIWLSIFGALPFTLLLPYADLFWTAALTIVIGLIMASAFPAILVYAQELVPGRVGMIAGMFFGFAFGLGGLGAAALGRLADATSIDFVYHLTSYLPVLGLAAILLPNLERKPA
jgi:FSR family fosmidomycin resistance protein-like MFS transporter